MVEGQIENLFGIAVVAFVVPFVAGFFPRLRVPTIVLEILVGIVVGPSVLGWLEVDDAVAFLGLLGVAFLLFLAGLELDLDVLRGLPLRLGAAGFGISLVLAILASLLLSQVGIVAAPLLVAVALCSTSVGIIVPVLRDTGNLRSDVGVFAVAGGAAAEFGSIVLLGLLFGIPVESTTQGIAVLIVGLIALLLFGSLVAALLWSIERATRWDRAREVTTRLENTSSQLGTRAAVVLVLGMAALAAYFGFEPILGTFLAGIFIGRLLKGHDREDVTRGRLEAVGFGFLVPVFFIASGMGLDIENLFTPEEIGQVAIFAGLLVLVRGVPAVVYRRNLSSRGTVAVGFMQATNLSFLVVAVAVGQRLELMTPPTGSALVLAGLVSAIAFPAIAQAFLATETGAIRKPSAHE
jgi:Kef-type K+ transport system membrane component KefB